MKYISSKLIQKAEGRKKGIYEITLLISDYDLDMIENLATTYDPFQEYHDNGDNWDFKLPSSYFTKKYNIWLNKTWRAFWMLWNKHDD